VTYHDHAYLTSTVNTPDTPATITGNRPPPLTGTATTHTWDLSRPRKVATTYKPRRALVTILALRDYTTTMVPPTT